METTKTTTDPLKSSRQRSARRLRHEAQIDLFKKQVGDIEAVRRQLGLKPSEMSEILKVHPSAWTRWTKTGKVPPHIYQMLDWYLELLQWRSNEKPQKLEDHPRTRHDALIKGSLPSSVQFEEPLSQPSSELKRWRWHYVALWLLQVLFLTVLIALLRAKHPIP